MATPNSQQINHENNSEIMSFNGSTMMDDKEEELSRSALAMYRAKEEEIERIKMEVKDKVQTKLGRVEETTQKLAEIRGELETLSDPMRKDVSMLRKKIDTLNRELKHLGQTCLRKEREHKEVLEAYNEKNREKSLLVGKLVEMVNESERLRMKKLEELSKSIEITTG